VNNLTPSGDDLRLDLRAEHHRQTVGERGVHGEAEPLDSAVGIADRDPNLAATRRTAMTKGVPSRNRENPGLGVSPLAELAGLAPLPSIWDQVKENGETTF
jgi:hypothetical protein